MSELLPIQTYVTFGQKYSYEPHPLFEDAHPEMVLEVRSESYEEARELIFQHLNIFYAFDYPVGHSNPQLELYSRGVTHRLSPEGLQRIL